MRHELIHSDVCYVPMLTHLEGYGYFVCFLDDFSRFKTVYLISEKGLVPSVKIYAARVRNHTRREISTLRSGRGTEYINTELISYAKQNGIYLNYSTRYTPQQYGRGERLNRTIVEKASALLFDSNLPTSFWGYAVQCAVYLMNRSPHNQLIKQRKTPYELWTGRKPDLSHLRVFGTRAFVHVPKEKRKKFDPKSKEIRSKVNSNDLYWILRCIQSMEIL